MVDQNDKEQMTLLKKIQALLITADPTRGATEAERDNALRMAERLMFKHNLEMADLQIETDERAMVQDEAGHYEVWRSNLLHGIAEVFHVKVWFVYGAHDGGKRYMVLAGRKETVRVVKELEAYVAQQIAGECAIQHKMLGQNPRYASIAVHEYAYQHGTFLQFPITDANRQDWDDWCSNLVDNLNGPEGIHLIMELTGLTYNYASEIRPFLKRHQLAPQVIKKLAVWKRSFIAGATSTVIKRLEEMHQESVEEHGDKGVALVRSERANLEAFLNEIGVKTQATKSTRKIDPHAYKAGRKAGESMDISVGNKIENNPKRLPA